MSYLALARKWRPRNFADLVGQGHVVQALTNALGADRLHHAYLFSGTRGVGKTTIARIFAKALNCEQGVVAEPCGRCSACLEIDDGRFVDLIEVDAASRTRVDDTREILDNVQYAPARGRYKVYLIDEVHMLSAHSFNALLKTLEEPPEHVKFLLATTDPQKLPVTVLSRCLQFNLKRLPHRLIGERLERICAEEQTAADPAALALLARAANGSMRDGLSLLDQAIAFGGGEVREPQTREILGTVERRDVEQLLEALLGGDAASLLATCERIDEQFPDYGRLLDELASVLQRIAVWQVAGRADAGDGDDTAFIEKAAAEMAAADVQLYYQTALIGKRDLELAPDVRSGFEMTLLRMIAFRPAAAGAPAGQSGDGNHGGGRRSPPGTAAGAGKTARPQAAKPAPAPAAAPADRPPAGPSSRPPATVPAEPDWYRIVADLNLSGVERMMAGNCAWERSDGHRIYLTIDELSASQLSEGRREALQAALAEHFGGAISLDIRVAGDGGESPAQRERRAATEAQARLAESIQHDPNIETLKNLFDAEVEIDTVRARGEHGPN